MYILNGKKVDSKTFDEFCAKMQARDDQSNEKAAQMADEMIDQSKIELRQRMVDLLNERDYEAFAELIT